MEAIFPEWGTEAPLSKKVHTSSRCCTGTKRHFYFFPVPSYFIQFSETDHCESVSVKGEGLKQLMII